MKIIERHSSQSSAADDDGRSVQSDDSAETVRRRTLVEEQLMTQYEHELEEQPHRRPSPVPRPVPPSVLHQPHAYPCQQTHKSLPSPPKVWPQRPLMLRPTPQTPTKIRGIRYANSRQFEHFPGFCAGCILPINTGREANGQSLVIDFESNLFVGTLLMRLQQAPPVKDSKQQQEQNGSYFDGKKRKFQAVVKGKFKTALRTSDCVTGQCFRRPAGPLPARWIVTGFIKLVSSLAPQLEASLDADEPRFLTPLVATAQTVLAKETTNDDEPTNGEEDEVMPSTRTIQNMDERWHNFKIYPGSLNMEEAVEEPLATDPMSLMNEVPGVVADMQLHKHTSKRQKVRKKAYNHLFAQGAEEPRLDTTKEYTFEFYQHLLWFGPDMLAIDMGRGVKVDLARPLDGQPIQFMAAHRNRSTGELNALWSFDIWHESLYKLAQAAEGGEDT